MLLVLLLLQDFDEVEGAAKAVFEVTEMMTDECPDPEAVGAQQLSSLNKELEQAHEALQDTLQQASGQQPAQGAS